MTIDMHAHWLPEAFCDAMRARSTPPFIRRKEDGHEYLESAFNSSPLAQRESAEQRIAEMDKGGVERGVLSLTTVYGVERLPSAEAVPLCQAFNDAVAAVCARYPERFNGLAALPIADLDETLKEFHRAMAMPGMVGALLPGDGFLSIKRAQNFASLFEAANALRAIFLVHYAKIADDPEAPKVDASDNGHSRVGTLDMQARLSSNMITFCMTDFLKAYPDVTVLSHNLGGNIPFEIERLDHRSLLDRPQDELPSKRIKEAAVLVDCNSLGAKSIELAVDCYGAERIVYGSDGTGFGMGWTNKAIADARISEADRNAIRHGNAARALGRVRKRQAA